MSSVLESSELLQLCPVPKDIQNIILYMLIGYGTAASVSIRTLITDLNAPNNIYKTTILFRFYPSLWRYLVLKNGSRITSYVKHPEIYNNLECIYEIQMAYLEILKSSVGILHLNNLLVKTIKTRLLKVIKEDAANYILSVAKGPLTSSDLP